MNALVIFMLFALASPIFGEDAAVEPKKQEKRGIYGLGYGGYAGHYGGHGYGYGHGLGHGYASAPYYSGYNHVSPVYSHSAYSHVAPVHGYSGYHSPLYSAPRYGYHGLGHGYYHGL